MLPRRWSSAALLPVLAALLPAAGALQSPPAADAAKRPTLSKGVYATPGYKGRKQPRTGPAPAPPSVTLATNGWKPDVLVDAAGTSHVVWVEKVDAQGAAVADDIVHYCRLPRGAKACDNPNQTPLPPAATPSEDYAGPRILQIGDGLVLLTARYPAVVQHPDGQTSDRTLYASTSTDGGTTWSPPRIVGTQGPQGGAIVWGGAASRISVISDTQTGGTVVQTVSPGNYTRASALVGPGDEAYSGRLALDGEQPVAAFSGLDGNAVLRRLPAGADPADPAAWTRQVVPGLSAVDLASGPRGVFLFGQPLGGGDWSVRPVTNGAAGAPEAPIPSPPGGTGRLGDFVQDGSGALHGFVRDTTGNALFQATSRDGGASWGPAKIAARAVGASGGLDDIAAAATADGGGLAVYRRDATGLTNGTIAAAAFGTLSPTGKPGAGALAGTGVPGAVAGCERAAFGALSVTPLTGCLLPSVDAAAPGAVVSDGPVDLNGLQLVPDAKVRITIDPRRRTIDSTGKVRVLLKGGGLSIELLHAELHLKLDGKAGSTLLDLDPSGLDLGGFPIAGRVRVLLTPTGVRIPITVALPGGFGGITGDATLLAEKDRGLTLESLKIAVKRAPLGPIEVRDLAISYTGASETWTGKATVGLPPQPGGAALGASVTFVKGRFTMGDFSIAPPFPGVLVGPQTYITQLRGGFGLDPVKIRVGASFGAIPVPPNLYTVLVRGDVEITVLGDTVQLVFRGTGEVADTVPMANVVVRASTDGYADLTAGYDVDLKVVAIKGDLQGFIDGTKGTFGTTASASVSVAGVPTTGGRFALSSKGVGICYSALGASIAGGYRFGEGIPDGVHLGATLSGCDLSDFEEPRTRARVRQVGAPAGTTVSVAGGTKVQNVELTGTGGAPDVVLQAPDGREVVPVDGTAAGSLRGAAVRMTLPAAERSVVILRDPTPGTWTVLPREGSPALRAVRVARDVKPVRVSAQVRAVRGRSARRELRYVVRDRGDAVVELAERSAGATGSAGGVLGRATRTRGTIRFAPGGLRGGKREIVATVSRGGVPVSTAVVARYTAPAPARLAAPRRVRVTATTTTTTVRWRAVGGARGYLVRVRGARSKRVVARIVGRSRSAVVPGIGTRDGRVTATVVARDRDGRSGRPGSGRARR
ncbi:sialidase family protein [Patulibacter brassicae]|uniref:Sialidase family protein n=1 Tax=Patulibacter brassicae TaxID=1705717 RepID=A0ABU4VFT7_9ACTN|nr:sialidase family protein [Patulibacter brassicae]MDX8150653.1 sialidase family protein [Patulibacter brassicae]